MAYKAQTFGEVALAPAGDRVVHLPNRIDIFNGWLGMDAGVVIDQAELLDGVKVARLLHVAHYKRLLARPKDLQHLQLMNLNFGKPR